MRKLWRLFQYPAYQETKREITDVLRRNGNVYCERLLKFINTEMDAIFWTKGPTAARIAFEKQMASVPLNLLLKNPLLSKRQKNGRT